LDLVCDLHVMSQLERDRAWFLEHGRLTPARAKALTAAVNELCGELRVYAGTLVEAFAIPDVVLAAPIALGEEAARQAAKATQN
jgi:acyl-CoA oxidase